MQYKDILVYLDQGDSNAARVKAALDMAATFGAQLTGVVVNPLPALDMYQRFGPLRGEELVEKLRAEAESTLEQFETAASEQKVACRTRVLEARANQAPGQLARVARNFDLNVLRQPNPDRENAEFVADLCEEVLFTSGRPMFVVPYIGVHAIPCRRAVIAWNGASSAARAVHDAMPLLERAEEVIILVVDPDEIDHDPDFQPGEDLSSHLSAHGINNRVARAHSGEVTTTSVILNHVFESNADVLIMGGYGTPKLREVILGGVTRSVLGSMTVPVVMSH